LEDLSEMSVKGEIHSAFENCVNGLFNTDQVFNIIPERTWVNPRSIQVTQNDWVEHQLSQIDRGDSFHIDEQILYIPDLNIYLDLKKAMIWDPNGNHFPRGLSIHQVLENLRIVKIVFDKCEDRFMSSTHFNKSLKERVLFFKRSLVDGNHSRIDGAITSLIGFGPGLTPTGDDFLTGFMAALHFLERIGYCSPYGNKIFDFIKLSCIGKTSLISQQMLLDGASGQFALPITKLMKDILTRDDEDLLKDSINNLLGLGAYSGFDILGGILCGIELSLFNPLM